MASRISCVSGGGWKVNHLLSVHSKRCFYVGSNKIQRLSLSIGSAQKQLKGEDSFFLCESHRAFGVADGVGGWAGIKDASPKLFAEKVMSNCQTECEKTEYTSAKQLLVDASLPIMKSELLGGTTALVSILTDDNILDVANIGDSRLYVFRRLANMGYTLYFMTPEQIALFNAPLQLGAWKYVANDDYLVIDPRQWTESFSIPLMPLDIIVSVTDGVSDNVFPESLLKLILTKMNSPEGNAKQGLSHLCQTLAQNIVNHATSIQSSAYQQTPFGTPKPDDTTAVVAITSLSQNSAEN